MDGDTSDVDALIRAARRHPEGSPQYVRSLGTVAGVLARRFFDTRDLATLKRAASLYADAVFSLDVIDPTYRDLLFELGDTTTMLMILSPPEPELLQFDLAVRRIINEATRGTSHHPSSAANLGTAIDRVIALVGPVPELLAESRAAWADAVKGLTPTQSDWLVRRKRQAMNLLLVVDEPEATDEDLCAALDVLRELAPRDCEDASFQASLPWFLASTTLKLARRRRDFELAAQAHELFATATEERGGLIEASIAMVVSARSVEQFDHAWTCFTAAMSGVADDGEEQFGWWGRVGAELGSHPMPPFLLDETLVRLDAAKEGYAPGTGGRSAVAWVLSNLLVSAYESTGAKDRLLQALDLKREILLYPRLSKTDRLRAASGLAGTLGQWYDLSRQPAVLQEGIDVLRSALTASDLDPVQLAGALSNLGTLLSRRAAIEDGAALRREAIDVLRRALALCPPEHPDRIGVIVNLANATLSVDDAEALPLLADEITPLLRDTLDKAAGAHSVHLHHVLALVLMRLGKARGDAVSLQAAVAHAQQAVQAASTARAVAPVLLETYEAALAALSTVDRTDVTVERYRSTVDDLRLPLTLRVAAGKAWAAAAQQHEDWPQAFSACTQTLPLAELLLSGARSLREYEDVRTHFLELGRVLLQSAVMTRQVEHISLLAHCMRIFRRSRHAGDETEPRSNAPGRLT
jgi:hypothetical protein